ncbi:MAG TPA: helix-turn-helix domain-containing protein [Blastocatellia bacterium]|nr:helix-turn-helix domain-containing protein [Blastocatellia bacterium]
MVKDSSEDLSHFVKRVMRLKGLTLRDVEVRARGRITDGYISGIISGTAKNPSVEKIKALAEGLGVTPDELFHVACGVGKRLGAGEVSADASEPLSVIEMLQKVLADPEIIELLYETLQLLPSERKEILKRAKAINQSKSIPQYKLGVG